MIVHDELWWDVANWHAATFPDESVPVIIRKLQEEVGELLAVAERVEAAEFPYGGNEFTEEVADVVICWIALQNRLGLHQAMLNAAVSNKHRINEARIWGTPDANGVRRHV